MKINKPGFSLNRRIINYPGGAMTRAAYLLIILITAGVLTSPRLGIPAESPDKPAEVQESTFQTSPVTIDGTVLFNVRGLEAFPSEKRASRIGDLIEKAAKDHSVRPDAITAVETALTTDIIAGKRAILSVHDADARPEGLARQELARI